MKKIVIIILVAAIAGGTAALILLKPGQSKKSYQYTQVTRGNLSETISCTGTLKLRNAVAVNFQTTGTVAQVLADFNQKVKKGQVLAVLDKTLLKFAVQTAEANILNAKNQLAQAQKNYADTQALFNDQYKSQSDMDTAKINLDTAKVNSLTSQIALDQAKANLDYAVLYSPIDGLVIERNVSVGQTIFSSDKASSLSTNFFVADDTSKMQIFATVDESDITSVKTGQKVSFTVQSYADKTFTGRVSQVRLQPVTSDNVVVYTIVVDADNPKNLLIPGMTATLDIETASRTGVLRVPNTVLKFQPPADLIRSMIKSLPKPQGKPPEGPPPQAVKDSSIGTLWTYDEKNGKLGMITVKIGMSDGQMTEVSALHGNLEEGTQILSGVGNSANSKTSGQKSILNSVVGGGPGSGGPPPGM